MKGWEFEREEDYGNWRHYGGASFYGAGNEGR